MQAKRQSKRRLPLLTAAILSLSSCGMQISPKELIDRVQYEYAASDVKEEGEPIVMAAKQREISIVWRRDIGDPPPFASLAGVDNGWCAASKDGAVSFTAPDGEASGEAVRLRLDGEDITAAVACADGVIVVGDDIGVVRAYDFAGEPLWRDEMRTRLFGAPLIDKGRLFALGLDGQLTARSAKRGNLLWSHIASVKEILHTPLESSPAIWDNVIYAGLNGGGVIALNSTDGKALWEASLASEGSGNPVSNIANVTTPAVGENVVCAAGYQSAVGCFSRNNGDLLWRERFSATRQAALDDDGARLFVADIGGRMRAFVAANGEELWNRQIGGRLSAPVFIPGAVAVGDEKGVVRFLTPDGGESAGDIDVGGGVVRLQKVDEKSILALTKNGELSLLRIEF